MRDLVDHGALLVVVLLFEVAYDVLEGFQVASQCDFDAFFIADAFDDGSEVLDVFQSPLLVQVDNGVL